MKFLHWVQGWQHGKEKGTWVAVWAPPFNNWVTVGKSLNLTEPCSSELRLGAVPVACVIRKENLRACSVCSKSVTCLAVLEGFSVLVRVCATRFQPEVGRSWLGGQGEGLRLRCCRTWRGLDFRHPLPSLLPLVCHYLIPLCTLVSSSSFLSVSHHLPLGSIDLCACLWP